MGYKLIVFALLIPFFASAQIGGQTSYTFTNIPSNTRLVGLGGVNVSLANEDVNLAFSNPALSGDTLSGLASFSYLDYFADAGIVTAIYQHDFGKLGSWFLGVNHLDYGEFDSYDATGADLGTFDSGETQLILGRNHTIGVFTLGASLKFLNSNIGGFNSSALAMDLGGVFSHPSKQVTFGLVFKNVGFILQDYSDDSDSKLPFDIQVGTTIKPEHMPFRFSLTGYNLTDGNISYFDPNNTADEEEPGELDNALRHVNVGVELLLSKNINLRFGYNHLVRQELKLPDTGGGAGFSFGLMFRVKAFEFSYSRGGYHAAGGSNSFTLTANTNKIFKNRRS
ncbi:type IX secretion system protein PorQ [Fulvivirga lutea]|uniref:Type IX secretion system protein PorQ n=1 Tax=Fulvivirga lutea TaxID=2810512 RepID=A0A974WFS4_9BACT|nr:type IX secretion system protein PorQ [Fulvivirga lutea]QSE97441.1 type IX secretion system protein PorQ [Fulvivirga lutea]